MAVSPIRILNEAIRLIETIPTNTDEEENISNNVEELKDVIKWFWHRGITAIDPRPLNVILDDEVPF